MIPIVPVKGQRKHREKFQNKWLSAGGGVGVHFPRGWDGEVYDGIGGDQARQGNLRISRPRGGPGRKKKLNLPNGALLKKKGGAFGEKAFARALTTGAAGGLSHQPPTPGAGGGGGGLGLVRCQKPKNSGGGLGGPRGPRLVQNRQGVCPTKGGGMGWRVQGNQIPPYKRQGKGRWSPGGEGRFGQKGLGDGEGGKGAGKGGATKKTPPNPPISDLNTEGGSRAFRSTPRVPC